MMRSFLVFTRPLNSSNSKLMGSNGVCRKKAPFKIHFIFTRPKGPIKGYKLVNLYSFIFVLALKGLSSINWLIKFHLFRPTVSYFVEV